MKRNVPIRITIIALVTFALALVAFLVARGRVPRIETPGKSALMEVLDSEDLTMHVSPSEHMDPELERDLVPVQDVLLIRDVLRDCMLEAKPGPDVLDRFSVCLSVKSGETRPLILLIYDNGIVVYGVDRTRYICDGKAIVATIESAQDKKLKETERTVP